MQPNKEANMPAEDILLDQIVEDEDGNMHVMPEEFLIKDSRAGINPVSETELAVENLEKDMACADVMDE